MPQAKVFNIVEDLQVESHNTTRSDEDNTTVEHMSDRSHGSTHQLRIVPMKVPQRLASSTTNSTTGPIKALEKSSDDSKILFSTSSEP